MNARIFPTAALTIEPKARSPKDGGKAQSGFADALDRQPATMRDANGPGTKSMRSAAKLDMFALHRGQRAEDGLDEKPVALEDRFASIRLGHDLGHRALGHGSEAADKQAIANDLMDTGEASTAPPPDADDKTSAVEGAFARDAAAPDNSIEAEAASNSDAPDRPAGDDQTDESDDVAQLLALVGLKPQAQARTAATSANEQTAGNVEGETKATPEIEIETAAADEYALVEEQAQDTKNDAAPLRPTSLFDEPPTQSKSEDPAARPINRSDNSVQPPPTGSTHSASRPADPQRPAADPVLSSDDKIAPTSTPASPVSAKADAEVPVAPRPVDTPPQRAGNRDARTEQPSKPNRSANAAQPAAIDARPQADGQAQAVAADEPPVQTDARDVRRADNLRSSATARSDTPTATPERQHQAGQPVAAQIEIGQSRQSPAQTVSTALGADPVWSTYFRDVPSAPKEIKSLQIQLKPVELGVVTANLINQGDSISVEIEAQTLQARDHLSMDSDQIVKSLRAVGIEVDQVTVRLAENPAPSTDRSDGQPQRGFAGEAGPGGNRDGQGRGVPHQQSRHDGGGQERRPERATSRQDEGRYI
ncbi:MAG: flagellar hook-length control protein FliK [Mesorhizobium sp.]